MEKLSIATYLRIKPSLKSEISPITYDLEEIQAKDKNRSVIELHIPLDNDQGFIINNSKTGKIRFEYDHVFDSNTDQEEIFDVIAKDKIHCILNGISCTIFAYGQTGTGKTYTIFGGDNYPSRGLIPRSVGYLFDEINLQLRSVESFSFKCQISFTEIYNETVYDLLDDKRLSLPKEEWVPVQLMEGENGIVLRNLNVYEVKTVEEALHLFFMGNRNRITASTVMNALSSRSHGIFTILLETQGIKTNQTLLSAGKLNLVDLAGSERMYKVENTKNMIKEAKSINLSLHYLEQVIITLRDQVITTSTTSSNASKGNNKSTYIPYRNSMLTNMLRDSLGGNCKSCFIMTINTDEKHFEETIATCRFGQRCGEVTVEISANTEVSISDQLRDLTVKNKILEKQLLQLENEKKQMISVQLLLSAAKESMVIANNNNSNQTDAEKKILQEEILERSQDQLFETVQLMDKAVLVELSTALGGLIQSMFIERETTKHKQMTAENQQKEILEKQKARDEEDKLLIQKLITRNDRKSIYEVSAFPQTLKNIVLKGALFIKHSVWFGKKEIRYFTISEDLTKLEYRNVTQTSSSASSVCKDKDFGVYYIHTFDNILDLDPLHPLEIHLIGSQGHKSIHLEYANGSNIEENKTAIVHWIAALKFLIFHK